MSKDPVLLTMQLINFASVTPIDAGVIDYLTNLLAQMGFKCHKLVYDDVTNLYARFGKGSKNFCFAGHTDVVPVGDISAWNSDPFKAIIKDNILYGRGAVDMKTSIACFIAAASSFIGDNKDFAGSISLLITGDEEGPGKNGTIKVLEWMKQNNETMSSCLVGEPTSYEQFGDMVKIGRRGSVCFKIKVNGTQGHVAYPHLADNPVTKLINILYLLKTTKLDDGNEFFQASNLEVTSLDVGNKSTNTIPSAAHANFNIRYNNFYNKEGIITWVNKLCERITADFQLEVISAFDSFITKDDNYAALVCDSVTEVTGKTPVLSTTGGTSDARFIKDHCPVIEFGPLITTAHKVNEHVPVADIVNLTEIYLKILQKYFA